MLPGILFTLAGAYPFLEAKMTKDTSAAQPAAATARRPGPHRRSGAMAITFYVVLFLSGGNDLIAKAFDISLNAMTWGGRIALLIAAAARLRWSPTGSASACSATTARCSSTASRPASSRCCRPVSSSRSTSRSARSTSTATASCSYAGTPVPKRMNQLGAASPLQHVRGFFYPVKEKPEIQAALDELEQADEAALESGDAGDGRRPDASSPTERPLAARLWHVVRTHVTLQVLVDADNVVPRRVATGARSAGASSRRRLRIVASGRDTRAAPARLARRTPSCAAQPAGSAPTSRWPTAYVPSADPLLLVSGDGDFGLLATRHPGPVLVVSGAASTRLRDGTTVVDPATDGVGAIEQWLATYLPSR